MDLIRASLIAAAIDLARLPRTSNELPTMHTNIMPPAAAAGAKPNNENTQQQRAALRIPAASKTNKAIPTASTAVKVLRKKDLQVVRKQPTAATINKQLMQAKRPAAPANIQQGARVATTTNTSSSPPPIASITSKITKVAQADAVHVPQNNRQSSTAMIITAAQYRRQTRSYYPRRALELGQQQSVVLHVHSNIRGEPEQLKIAHSSGYVRLDKPHLLQSKNGNSRLSAAMVVQPVDGYAYL